MNDIPLKFEQWVELAFKELVSAGFNPTEGLRAYAMDLARRDMDKLSPKQSVDTELGDLE